MSEQYRYDAFISYRHSELDKFVAENLHKLMESFRLPGKAAAKANGRTAINRVFRDRDELPLASNLADPITEALSSSEFLIVICSPRLPQSRWCAKEIETFISMHGRDKVFAVLIEGEPADSFPPQLLYEEREITDENGVTQVEKIPVEPLAADVRGANNKEVYKALKSELLRLLAPMFGLSYDDLRQRHRERRMKRIITASLSAAAVCLAFGAVSTTMALRIHAQKEQIAGQNEEITEQNRQITAQNVEIRAQADEIKAKNDSLALNQANTLAAESERLLAQGDREGAVESAKKALTDWEGIAMPYTARAQYALTEAEYVYSVGSTLLPIRQLSAEGIIDAIRTSPEKNYYLCSDSTGSLYLYAAEDGQLIETFNMQLGYDGEDAYCFINEDALVYTDAELGTTVYTISKKEKEPFFISGRFSNFLLNKGNNVLWCSGAGRIVGIDTATLETKYSYSFDNILYGPKLCASDMEGKYLAYTVFNAKNSELHLVDFSAEEPGEMTFYYGEDSYGAGSFWDGSFYCIINHSENHYSEFEMTVHCFDMNRLAKKWSYVQEDAFGSLICVGVHEDAKHLLAATTGEVVLVDKEDGSLYSRFAMGSSTVALFTSTASDLFFAFTRDGQMHSILPDKKTDYQNNMYSCFSDNVRLTITCSDGFAMVPYASNKATVYGFCNEDALTPYDGTVKDAYADAISYAEAEAFGKEHGLPNSARIDRVAVGEDGVGYAHYRDGKEIVVDETGRILSSFAVEDTVYTCFGKDKQGNTYIGGGGSGYILNKDYELIGRVESMAGLLPDSNLVIVRDVSGDLYTLPIRSVEDLLAYEP